MQTWELGADALAAAYARRELSPVETARACLARNSAVHSVLNAVVCVDEAGALAAARESEKRYASGAPRGPLDGVPFTVKDNLYVRGVRATWGSQLYADHVPQQDDIAVARLRAAGAVFLGKTNTPELALAGYTDNAIFGTTRNPWNSALTPGGSSGGAVAATAAGIAPLALATDGGGSTRVPASLTGVLGLRPSTGRVPRMHGFPQLAHDLQVVGLVARSVRDLASFFEAVALPHEADTASLTFPGPGAEDVSTGMRIRLVTHAAEEPVDAQARAAAENVAKKLATMGHIVSTGTLPFDNAQLRQIWTVLSGAGAARVVVAHSDWESRVTPGVLQAVRSGLACSAVDYVRTLDLLADVRRQARAVWHDSDLVVTPGAATLPWPANEANPRQIDGQPAGPGAPSVFAKWVNAAALPAISVPAGFSREGLPLGVQIVAPYGGDRRLLAIAARLEEVNGPARQPRL